MPKNQSGRQDNAGVAYETAPANAVYNAAGNDLIDQIDIVEIWRSIWMRKWLVVLVALAGAGLGAVYASQLPSTFMASVQVMISDSRNQISGVSLLFDQRSAGRDVVSREAIIIKSDKVLGRVVDSLDLEVSPEFNVRLAQKTFSQRFLNLEFYLPYDLLVELGLREQKVEPTTSILDEMNDEKMRAEYIRKLAGRIQVNEIRGSRSIFEISFVSTDRRLAPEVVNKIAEEYLNEQLEAKFDATERATNWLSDRLERLRTQVENAEAAVIAYKSQQTNQIGQSYELLREQITQLNGQLIAAQADLAGNEIRKKQVDAIVSSGDFEAVADFLASDAVEAARRALAVLERREAELAVKYGDKHPKMIAVRAEIRDAKKQLGLQINKQVQAIAAQVQVAQAKVDTIREALYGLEKKSAKVGQTSILLRQHEREAEASRLVYESFLAKFKETTGQEQLVEADSRVVNPSRVAVLVGPNSKQIVAASLGVGIVFGLGIAVLLGLLEVGFRSARELETAVDAPVLGQVPEFKVGKNSKRSDLFEYLFASPTSALAEAMRSLRVSIERSNIDNPPQVIMTTSAVPQEAKSITSALLSITYLQYGKSVLLIDADLRRPTVAFTSNVEAENTVVDVLSGEVELTDAIIKESRTGLDVLVGKEVAANANAIVSSKAFADLITECRKRYDIVIIDVPPVLAVSDALATAENVDAVLFAVRWGSTPKEVVKSGVKALRDARVNTVGAVLTRVDFERQARYGYGDYGYYYGKYGGYYNNEN